MEKEIFAKKTTEDITSAVHAETRELTNKLYTGKSLSEALILAHSMTKDCSLNHEFSTRKIHVQYMLCTTYTKLVFFSTEFVIQ